MPSMRTPVRRKIKRKLCKVCGKYKNPKQFDLDERVCRCQEVGDRNGQRDFFVADAAVMIDEDYAEFCVYAEMMIGLKNPYEVAHLYGRDVDWVSRTFNLEPYYGSF